MQSDVTTLRRQVSDLRDAAGRIPRPSLESSRFVAQTCVISTYPATAQAFYGLQLLTPFDPSHTEAEGTVATFAADAGKFTGYNLGISVPPVGTKVVAYQIMGIIWFIYSV